MRKLLVGLMIVVACVAGCGGESRKAALGAMDESSRVTNESVYDLYALAVKNIMAVEKCRLLEAAADGLTKDEVNTIINTSTQNIMNAAWAKENATKADMLKDHAWVYIRSRESFLELAVEDIKASYKKAKEVNVTTQPANAAE